MYNSMKKNQDLAFGRPVTGRPVQKPVMPNKPVKGGPMPRPAVPGKPGMGSGPNKPGGTDVTSRPAPSDKMFAGGSATFDETGGQKQMVDPKLNAIKKRLGNK